MITLWIFGDNVEDRMGRPLFLAFYLVMALFSGVAQIASNPMSETPIIGASGAVAGVMGAYLVMFPHSRVILAVPIFFFIDFWEVPAPVFFLIWFLIQFFSGAMGLLSGGESLGGIAWWAHIGGFVGGMIAGLFFRQKPKIKGATEIVEIPWD
jgi:membrane associated rhomboid family serine protease